MSAARCTRLLAAWRAPRASASCALLAQQGGCAPVAALGGTLEQDGGAQRTRLAASATAAGCGKWLGTLKARSFSTSGEQPVGESGSEEQRESENSNNAGNADRTKARLLTASLSHVKALGWSQAAIVAGAKDIGLSPSVGGMLERGEAELVEHFVKERNAEFIAKLQDMAAELHGMRMGEKMFTAIKMRLEMNIPHIDSWPQALAVLGQPQNAPYSLAILTNLVDDIWHTLGDRSVDMSWYTKRGLLAGVYVSTELYMLTDSSPDFHDTWEALQRRLDDVHAAGGLVREVNQRLEHILRGAGFPSTSSPPKSQAEDAQQTSTSTGADVSQK